MSNRQRLTILVVLIALVITGTGLYYLFFKETTGEKTPVTSNTGYEANERVLVANLHEYTDPETTKSIERMLYKNIKKDQPDLFTGIIRDTSFLKTTLPSNQTESTLLIDVQPQNVAYRITLFSNLRGGRPSINIECASQEQQPSPSTTCKDLMHHD